MLDSHQELVTACPDGALAERVVRDPMLVLTLFALIGENRGEWPSDAVTGAARQVGTELGETGDRKEMLRVLTRGMVARDVDAGLEWLSAVGFLGALMPEVEATRDLAQEAGRRHKDVWEHTKLVVRQAVPRPAVRWGALLHDIGKVPTRKFTDKGVTFHGHAEVGARMFDKMSRRLPFDRPTRQKIRFLIKHHLRSNQYSEKWTDNAVRRFGREMEAHLTDLLDLSRADITSRRPGRRKFLLSQISELSRRVEDLRALDAVKPPLPTGVGNAMMSHFKLPPSRLIGDLKRAMEEAIEKGELEPHREDAYYIEWLAHSGLIPSADE